MWNIVSKGLISANESKSVRKNTADLEKIQLTAANNCRACQMQKSHDYPETFLFSWVYTFSPTPRSLRFRRFDDFSSRQLISEI